MRVFIAILFPDEINEVIYDALEEVEEISESGNFTSFENLHLTLLYIGEVDRQYYNQIKLKLNEIKMEQFSISTNQLDFFRKSGDKKIVFLGVDKSFQLERLYQLISIKIKEIGKMFPTEKYTPHITFGRQVRLVSDNDLETVRIKKQNIKVERISIMESTRMNGVLTYIERDSIPLN